MPRATGAAETQQDLTLTIARRPVSVTAQAASKAYGQTDPAFTYTTSAVAGTADSGLVMGDSLTGVLSREQGEGVGSYDLTQGTLTDQQNPNYTIVFEGTDRFTIQKAAMGLTLTTTPSAQKVGSPVKITIAAKNMESNLMESGWMQPDGTVLLTGPDGNNIPLSKDEEGSWNGSYTIPNSTPVGATLLFTASATDKNYTDATETTSVTVTDKGLVNLTLTPDRTGVTYGDTVTYTFTAAKADPSDPDELTGKVQFYLDGTDEAHKTGEAQELSGEVKLTLDRTSLTAGSHTVYAVYSGNTGFSGASVNTTTLVVPKALAWNTDGITADKAYDGTVSAAAVAGTLNITGVLDGDDVSFAYTALTAPDFVTAEPHTEDVTLLVAGGALTGAQADNYQLPVSGPVVTVSINKVDEKPVEPPVEDDNDYKLDVEEGISTVPEELEKNPDLDTPAKIERMLKTQITDLGVAEGNLAIYDVTLMVSEDGGKTWFPATKENFPQDGKLTVVLPYPEGTSRTTHNFKVVHMFTTSDFGKTPGETETPSVSKTADGIRFTVTGLSPIAVGWTEIQSGGGSGSGSSYRDGEEDFWRQVRRELEKAQSGDTVKANAAGYDRMPLSVMEALDETDGVTLHITWSGGEDIIIPASAALKAEVGRVYYPLSYLAEMSFSATTSESGSMISNPQTGGLLEVTAPVQENESALTLGEITPPDQGMTIAPEVTQPTPEENAFGNGTVSAAASQNSILLWLAAAVLLAAAGTGLWLYKRRKAG